MVDIVRLPKLGLSESGELVAWEADVGEHVETDQLLAVVESDKASAEVTAETSGVLLARYVEVGEEIDIDPGRPIAVLGEEGESAPTLAELDDDTEAVGSEAGNGVDDSAADADDSTADTSRAGGESASDDVKATPRAKRYAAEHGVSLATVEGTGPQNAITEDDVKTQTDTGGPASAVAKVDDAGDDSVRSTPEESSGGLTLAETRSLSATRKTVAERLSQSAREKPHVLGTRDIGIERLREVADKLDEDLDVAVSLNDLLLHFIARTLEDLPEFNAHFEDGEHRLYEEVNVGYAVDSPKGLVVPVIKEAADRSIGDLASERRRLVDTVIEDEQRPSDIADGTFTVTNVGVFDMDVSYSIINPPQVAILAFGRRKPVPIVRDGEVRHEESITFSMIIDHRVLDGADSGAFLEQLATYLEYPGRAFDAV